MKVNLAFWVDEVGGNVERLQVDLKPFGYRVSPYTQLETLIADEDIHVEKGAPTIINVKTIDLPKNTMISPLNIMHHALGVVVDVVGCGIPGKIEESKCINRVLFIPIDDGEIRRGDIIGLLKVFFVSTGLLSRLLSLSPPKFEIKEKVVEGNVTWRDDGNLYRDKVKIKLSGYRSSNIGLWDLLVANETIEVKAGEVARIKIRELEIPPNTIVVPLAIIRNAYGFVLDLIQLGKPKRVEEKKKIHEAIFLPIEDGVIEKDDLIGVINVYYVDRKKQELTSIEETKKTEKVNIVYKKGRKIVRKKVEVHPYGYKRSSIARWECLIADENKNVKYNIPTVVKIKKVKIPSNTIVYPLSIMRHAYGIALELFYEGAMRRVEEEISIDKVVYLPIADGEIRKDDLLGVIRLYSVETGVINKVKSWYDRWIKMSDEELEYFVEGLQ